MYATVVQVNQSFPADVPLPPGNIGSFIAVSLQGLIEIVSNFGASVAAVCGTGD